MRTEKLNNLIKLKKGLKGNSLIIPEFKGIRVIDYKKNNKIISEKFLNKFNKFNKLIIRSSAKDEDTDNYSNAGKYLSKVVINEVKSIHIGIKFIIDKLRDEDEIIIQSFIENPDYSGVLFTRDLNDNSPYYTINIDKSKKTNVITSGSHSKTMETYVIHRSLKYIDRKFFKLIAYIKKIESIFKSERLDIEFAYKNKIYYIFQTRKLFKHKNKIFHLNEQLFIIEKKLEKILNKIPFISGTKNILSNMADWNPAEIIGVKPNPLALSIYKELITDEIWAESRSEFGYKNVNKNPLIYNLGGSPYVDLRLDMNSFLVSGLNPKDEEKIINFYVNKIKKDTSIHDKIEFKTIPNCYVFDKEKYTELSKIIEPNVFSYYKKKLKEITMSNFFNKKRKKELNLNLKSMNLYLQEINETNISYVQKIYLINKICKQYGTKPFASIARNAFIASEFINDLNKLNILSNVRYEEFYNSIKTISKKINIDLNKFSKKKFISLYGHIRPSTYNIEMKNYSEGYEKYFSKGSKKDKSNKVFKLTELEKSKILKTLLSNNIDISADALLKICRKCIEERENAKLQFTKCIDQLFVQIKLLGTRLSIPKNDLKFIKIDFLLSNYESLSLENLSKKLKLEIESNKKEYKSLDLIKLPDVISSHKDVYFFKKNNNKGNFITNKIVTSQLTFYKKNKNFKFDNKIIVIENADPGFDFLFSYKITGLITKYGGPNSHMAIRCAEYQIPAIIGLTDNYENLKNNMVVTIDCFQNKLLIG